VRRPISPAGHPLEAGGSNEESRKPRVPSWQGLRRGDLPDLRVLLAQFNRFLCVALVLSAVVMSTIGVLLGLLIMPDSPS
jgi:multidrug efflux pump